jgi:alkylation response protein AidB-like acyl-CoA dehydrogenase
MAIEFSFTPQQELFRRNLRKLLRAEVLPRVVVEKQGHGVFPTEAVQVLAAHGLLGVPIPREYGGAGLGEVGYCILAEEVGRIDSSIATIVGAHTSIGMTPIWLFGTEEQRRTYLPDLTAGRKLAAFALTEPTAGSDAASIKTQAVREGDHYILNGRKLWCTNGDRADVLTVTCVTDPALGARGGVTSFIVEKGTKGFEVGTIEDKMGIRNSSTAELIFENCRIPARNVLGQVGLGFVVALTALDGGRAGLAAGVLGGTKEMLDIAVEYAKSRRRRGTPLSQEQAVQWRLADLAAEIQVSEYIVYHTASLVEEYYHRLATGAHVPETLREEVSMNAASAKVFCSEMSGRATESTLEILGASSVLDRNRVEQAWRDQIISEIYEGTSEVQRLIIAREILRRGGTT